MRTTVNIVRHPPSFPLVISHWYSFDDACKGNHTVGWALRAVLSSLPSQWAVRSGCLVPQEWMYLVIHTPIESIWVRDFTSETLTLGDSHCVVCKFSKAHHPFGLLTCCVEVVAVSAFYVFCVFNARFSTGQILSIDHLHTVHKCNTNTYS